MVIATIIVSIVLSVFSTAVMSYISMATPIGPWIAPTLVLFAMLLFKLLWQKNIVSENLAVAVSAGSIGGILATAFGFSFPTLYFLDPELFTSWMADRLFFVTVLAGLAFSAGMLGMWLANVLEKRFVIEQQLSFPIGQLVYKMIAAKDQARKSFELTVGLFGTAVFCFLQDGLASFKGLIPKTLTLLAPLRIGFLKLPLIRLDIWPMLWAIGFVTGHVIALPLAVGALSKIFVVNPINHFHFPTLTSMEFILAFCSGMVLSGAVQSFVKMPRTLWYAVKRMMSGNGTKKTRKNQLSKEQLIELGVSLLFVIPFLTYFDFSAVSQVYLIVFSLVCAYQITNIAGKIGLAQLGRFATFVMVPAILLFKLNFVQTVLVATFVEVCGGVATDVLFGRKVAHLSRIPAKKIKMYQYLGLLVSSVCVGIVFWLLIDHFTLGSPELFAQRAQARQLLIDVKNFDCWVLIVGMLFGYVLKHIKMSPMMVLGGLLMPLNISLGLILGGMLALLTQEKEEWIPFWSGVFASNSIWMLMQTLL